MLRHGTALIGFILLLVFVAPAQARQHQHRATPRDYAQRLTLKHWHSWREWLALDAIIRPESGWDPCAHYPSAHDCLYQGWNACGIPQANPCPSQWHGRLFSTRWAQVRWLIRYIIRRYGDPLTALYYHTYRGGY